MKAILNCPFIPIASRMASHRGAQGAVYADMIRQTGLELDVNWSGKIHDHNAYDVLYVYHGNDWFGTMNLYGGMYAFPYAFNTRNLSQFKGKVYSLAIPFPAYHEMIAQKIEAMKGKPRPIQKEWTEVDLKNLERMHKTAEVVKFPHITDKIVIGDSHSICMYRPGWTVNSVPFKTLNGAISMGLESFITEVAPVKSFSEVEFYFGNIDVRHHLCRVSPDHRRNAEELATKYYQAVLDLPVKKKAIYELLPLENESRKLPKTGYYKDRPFWGTWSQRNEARKVFNDTVERLCSSGKVRFIRWTDYLLNSKGELDFDFMEKPQSIHLSREYYPHWQGENVREAAIDNPEETPSNTLESFFS